MLYKELKRHYELHLQTIWRCESKTTKNLFTSWFLFIFRQIFKYKGYLGKKGKLFLTKIDTIRMVSLSAPEKYWWNLHTTHTFSCIFIFASELCQVTLTKFNVHLQIIFWCKRKLRIYTLQIRRFYIPPDDKLFFNFTESRITSMLKKWGVTTFDL